MSLLALLTFIKNFSFVITDDCNQPLPLQDFILCNFLTLILLGACLIWVMCALLYFLNFAAFKWSDKESGYTITNVVEEEGAGLSFFLTLIVPLIIDNVNTLQGFTSFLLIVIIICVLLYRTNLFYANPILALLGYRVYKFTFMENSAFGSTECIGLCKGKIQNGQSIEYKKITETILYIKGR